MGAKTGAIERMSADDSGAGQCDVANSLASMLAWACEGEDVSVSEEE